MCAEGFRKVKVTELYLYDTAGIYQT